MVEVVGHLQGFLDVFVGLADIIDLAFEKLVFFLDLAEILAEVGVVVHELLVVALKLLCAELEFFGWFFACRPALLDRCDFKGVCEMIDGFIDCFFKSKLDVFLIYHVLHFFLVVALNSND